MDEPLKPVIQPVKTRPTYNFADASDGYSNKMISEIMISSVKAENVFHAFCQLSNWKNLFPDLMLVNENDEPFDDNAILVENLKYKTKHPKDDKFAVFAVQSKFKDSTGYCISARQIVGGAFFTEMHFTCRVEDTPMGVKFTQITDYTLPLDGYYGILNAIPYALGVDTNKLLVEVMLKSQKKLQRLMHYPDSFNLDHLLKEKIQKKEDRNFVLTYLFNLSQNDFYSGLDKLFTTPEKCKIIFEELVKIETDMQNKQIAKKAFIMFPYTSGKTEMEFDIHRKENDSITLISENPYKMKINFKAIKEGENTTQCQLSVKYDFKGWGFFNTIASNIPIIDDAVRGFLITTMRKLIGELLKTEVRSETIAKPKWVSHKRPQIQPQFNLPNLPNLPIEPPQLSTVNAAGDDVDIPNEFIQAMRNSNISLSRRKG